MLQVMRRRRRRVNRIAIEAANVMQCSAQQIIRSGRRHAATADDDTKQTDTLTIANRTARISARHGSLTTHHTCCVASVRPNGKPRFACYLERSHWLDMTSAPHRRHCRSVLRGYLFWSPFRNNRAFTLRHAISQWFDYNLISFHVWDASNARCVFSPFRTFLSAVWHRAVSVCRA